MMSKEPTYALSFSTYEAEAERAGIKVTYGKPLLDVSLLRGTTYVIAESVDPAVEITRDELLALLADGWEVGPYFNEDSRKKRMGHYAVNRHDGGVSIVCLVDGEADIQEFMGKWPAEMQAEHDFSSARQIDPADVPTDRTFREAWTGDFTVDMAKAREVHRNRLRAARAPLLASLDVEYQRADEARDAKGKKSIAAKKAALRDVTKAAEIDAAKTPEELAAVWPSILPPRA